MRTFRPRLQVFKACSRKSIDVSGGMPGPSSQLCMLLPVFTSQPAGPQISLPTSAACTLQIVHTAFICLRLHCAQCMHGELLEMAVGLVPALS